MGRACRPRRRRTPPRTRRPHQAVGKTKIRRLLSRRDIPLRERTLWRMLYETAARAAEILSLNVEDLDLENNRAPLRSKGGDTESVYWGAAKISRERTTPWSGRTQRGR
jgi:integrase